MRLRKKQAMNKHILPILFIASLAIIIYVGTLKNGFTYDDDGIIINNTFIKSLDNLPQLAQMAYFARSGELTYRPVTTLSYFLDYAVFGLKAWGYHLTSVLIHAANGVLLYTFLVLLFRTTSCLLPLFISILFITHPVLSEAVNAISFREDLLAFFFYIATLTLYLHLRKMVIRQLLSAYTLYFASCLLYFMALLSKEMALSFLLMIYCYEWVYLDRKRGVISIHLNKLFLGYAAVTLIYVYLRFFYFHNPVSGFASWSLIERILTMPWLIISCLKLILFPISLSADYDINPITSTFSHQLIFPLIAVVSLIAIAVRAKETDKELSFGILFFIIALVPIYNIIPLRNPFAERYLYLPVAGITIAIGSLIHHIFKIEVTLKIWKIIFILIILLSIYSLAAIKRNTDWKDGYSLWSDTIKKMPNSGRSHHNLGNAYLHQGKPDKAIEEYKIALRLRPDLVAVRNSLGYAYYLQGRFDEAISEYMTVLRFEPDNVDAHNNLGNLYDLQVRQEEAAIEYMTALKLNPYDAAVHNNLGLIFYKQGQLKEAENEYMTALKLNPDFSDAHNNLGNLYDTKGRTYEAINEYLMAIRLNPDHSAAHYNLGLVFYEEGRMDEAAREFVTVLKLSPNNAETHYSLGNAYRMKGLTDEAKREYETALSLNPGHSRARKAIESLK